MCAGGAVRRVARLAGMGHRVLMMLFDDLIVDLNTSSANVYGAEATRSPRPAHRVLPGQKRSPQSADDNRSDVDNPAGGHKWTVSAATRLSTSLSTNSNAAKPIMRPDGLIWRVNTVHASTALTCRSTRNA